MQFLLGGKFRWSGSTQNRVTNEHVWAGRWWNQRCELFYSRPIGKEWRKAFCGCHGQWPFVYAILGLNWTQEIFSIFYCLKCWHRSRFHVAVIQLLILALCNCALAPWADDVSAKLIKRVTLNQTQVSTVWPQDWFHFLSEVDRPLGVTYDPSQWPKPWWQQPHPQPLAPNQEFPGKNMDKVLTILPRFSSQVHEKTSYSSHREILPMRQPFFVLDYLF